MGGLIAMARKDTGLPLSVQDDKIGLFPHDTPHRQQRVWRNTALLALALLLTISYFQYGRWNRCSGSSPQVETAGFELPKEVQQAWAAHSPYFPAAEYVAPPDRCEIVQVNLLQRHGSRFPTASNAKKIKTPLQKLLNVGTYSRKKYEFLRTFEWDLGAADLLPLGAKESFDSGSEHYLRYKDLVKDSQIPFVRASDSERVVLSAANWTQGFSTASGDVISPTISVIISEENGANNTLDDSMCANSKSEKQPAKTWRDTFAPPIVQRINDAVPGAQLDNSDIVELMPLCAFETIFHGTASPFCNLFTVKEWQEREYYDDLSKYWKTGQVDLILNTLNAESRIRHGNSLGPIQGVGYVNELLARLTGQPVQDQTQTNQTLDASPVTFPLDRNFYADFSHDNQMVAIYSAIGLFRPDEPPPTDRLDHARTWRISRMTPFCARMITEKLRCGDDGEFVRILVNDAVQPLEFCGASEDGLCTLSAFVESQAYARSNGGGDWERCFS
ncbi:histidine phosphatase superfamily [Chiua virens]|nr:histidine phosphatase superfamily [Chiua virens]